MRDQVVCEKGGVSVRSEVFDHDQVPGVRMGLVRRVRGEIDAGTYETPEKLDAAVDAIEESEGVPPAWAR